MTANAHLAPVVDKDGAVTLYDIYVAGTWIGSRRVLWDAMKQALDVMGPGKQLGPVAMLALQRPADYYGRSPAGQWEIDKGLGLLDWDGDLTQ